ncbi:MAG: L-galactonate transporter [Pseudomonadota bacterium]|jgi:predicted MFS family arabinose efflux permease
MSPTPIRLSLARTVVVFFCFALAYFLSALIRAITATLSPNFVTELGVQAADLGLLAGGYFLGFSLTQLPLGRWLDRHGPSRVIIAFLSVAVVGCLAFAAADSFAGLLLARVLCGVGLSACLMAPLTGYRRWFDPGFQLRANAWMLMTGSLGMLASTLPVQWLLPIWGWRPMFVALGVLVALAMLLIALLVPRWERLPATAAQADDDGSYRAIWRNPYFWHLTPLGFFTYGGMVAIQTLWAGPWLTQVAGWSPASAAGGLFLINLAMLGAFWLWGLLTPGLARRGWSANRLMVVGQPLAFVLLGVLVLVGPGLGAASALVLALYCVANTFTSLAQPAVGMAYPSHLAGRALSAFNLVIFAGIFVVQWGIGLAVDLGRRMGMETAQAYQFAMGIYALVALLSWLHFVRSTRHNRDS